MYYFTTKVRARSLQYDPEIKLRTFTDTSNVSTNFIITKMHAAEETERRGKRGGVGGGGGGGRGENLH